MVGGSERGGYLFDQRLKRVRKRHLQPLKGNTRSRETPVQRTDVIGLRGRDARFDLLFPRAVGEFSLRDAQVCQTGVNP